MPRSGYYNLNLTPERQRHIVAIAQKLGLEGDTPTWSNTVGKVISFALQTVRYFDLIDFVRLTVIAHKILDNPGVWDDLGLSHADLEALRKFLRYAEENDIHTNCKTMQL